MNYLQMLWKEFLWFIGLRTAIKIKLTMGCNLRCPYCVITIADGRQATYEELTVEEWLNIIDNFPIPIAKVVLIGGEPFYYKDCAELTNELTKRKIVVKILTNGTYKRMLDVKPSPFVKFFSTYHHHVKKEHWLSLYNEMKKRKYRVHAIEVATQEIPGSEVLPLVCTDNEGAYYRRDIIFAPNGEIVLSLMDLYKKEGERLKVNWVYNPNKHYSIFQLKEKLRMLLKIH